MEAPTGIVPIIRPGKQQPAVAAGPVIYHGGPVIGRVEVIVVFWGAFWAQAGSNGGAQFVGDINSFFDWIVGSSLMDMLQEYSIPPNTIPPNTRILRGTRMASYTFGDTEPGVIVGGTRTVTDAQIQQALQNWIQTGRVPAATPNRLYFIYLPSGVVSTLPNVGASCTGYCGYHSHVNGAIFYAVVPFVNCNFCNFGPGLMLQTLTKISSHELAEAVTDPALNAWFAEDKDGSEIGDLCNNYSELLGPKPYRVQPEWSNAVQRCTNGADRPFCWESSVRKFHALDQSTVFILGNDGNLWFERAPFDHSTHWDSGVADFQGIAGAGAFVLGGGDGRLWLEPGPYPATPRTYWEGGPGGPGIKKFQALNQSAVFVLGNDGSLWFERTPVDHSTNWESSVGDFQAIPGGGALVLGGGDGRLWLEPGPFPATPRTHWEGGPGGPGIKKFQALNQSTVFILGNDANLWFEHTPFDHNTHWDSGVADFQALSGGAVYVLGGDGRLWFETAPFPAQPNRAFIASNVVAFQAMDEHNVFVQLNSGEVWKYRL